MTLMDVIVDSLQNRGLVSHRPMPSVGMYSIYVQEVGLPRSQSRARKNAKETVLCNR